MESHVLSLWNNCRAQRSLVINYVILTTFVYPRAEIIWAVQRLQRHFRETGFCAVQRRQAAAAGRQPARTGFDRLAHVEKVKHLAACTTEYTE